VVTVARSILSGLLPVEAAAGGAKLGGKSPSHADAGSQESELPGGPAEKMEVVLLEKAVPVTPGGLLDELARQGV
jgi:hypothetical protein